MLSATTEDGCSNIISEWPQASDHKDKSASFICHHTSLLHMALNIVASMKSAGNSALNEANSFKNGKTLTTGHLCKPAAVDCSVCTLDGEESQSTL